MKLINIFSYIDYKKFLNARIESEKATFGYKSRMAEAAGCQKSFLSNVLNGSIHLTPEHAVGLCAFWKFSSAEKEYFVELVHLGRAGTRQLREHVQERLSKLKRDHENLYRRFEENQAIPDPQAAVYYSAWHYSAAHIALTIPDFQTIGKIAARLRLPESFVLEVLQTLKALGLAENKGERWAAAKKVLHISRDSFLNGLHHGNWRQRAVENSFLRLDEDIHYTLVCSLSRQDMEKVRERLFDFIDESRRIIAPSKEEELFCITTDFFKV